MNKLLDAINKHFGTVQKAHGAFTVFVNTLEVLLASLNEMLGHGPQQPPLPPGGASAV
jgi:hypothetical protein